MSFLKFYLAAFYLLSMHEGCLYKESFTKSSLHGDGWSNRRETWRTEYEVLMGQERQKSGHRVESGDSDTYSDLFVIETNDTERVSDICQRYGLSLIRKIFPDENFYLFRRDDARKRFRRRAERIGKEIGKYSEIQWTSLQGLRDRVSRTLTPGQLHDWEDRLLHSEIETLIGKQTHHPSQEGPVFNDPLFEEQWYLHNRGQTGGLVGNDIGVRPVWLSGITGRGVTIAVLDDGVDPGSEEVAANYDQDISEEYLFRKTELQPIPENSHGTRCAAVAAGVANNSVCGVGVAYGATVGGVRILDGPLTDVQEALALVHALDHVDIYTASWGPTDRGHIVDGPKILARMAFIKGVTMGRRGRGALYVWAAGNGGGYGDDCGLDGYASSPFTLTVGALTEEGRSAFYSEPCASVLASVYVGGRCHRMPTPDAWKEDKKKIKVVAPEGRGKCEETFQGTSAAAPLAAGVFALILQANPDLTWRDVQHIVIRTSRSPPARERGWLTNGAGFRFHPKVGSGVLDAHAAVSKAVSWIPVDPLRLWTSHPDRTIRQLPPTSETSVPLLVRQSGIDRLETVIATISVRHSCRGALSMILESPSATPSPILTVRPRDNDTFGFERWDFVSLHFWGEDPEGEWTLRVRNHDGAVVGSLDYLAITLLGTGMT